MQRTPQEVIHDAGDGLGANGTASDTLAGLYRDQWDDYVRRFIPEENEQLGLLSDASNAQERQRAVRSVDRSYARALPDYQRTARGYGLNLSPQDIQSYRQRLNTQQGLDRVTAYNRTARTQQDRFYGQLGSNFSYSPGASINSGRGPLIQ